MAAVVRSRVSSAILPVACGAMLVGPLMALEWLSRRGYGEPFPWLLFTFMSVHALAIGVLLAPAAGRVRATHAVRTLTLGQWAGLVLALGLLCIYVGVVRDQWPCFVGVPNCD